MPKYKAIRWASLMVQRTRICLQMQGTWVQSMLQEDATYLRATKPMRHNQRKPMRSNEDPAQPKIKQTIKKEIKQHLTSFIKEVLLQSIKKSIFLSSKIY